MTQELGQSKGFRCLRCNSVIELSRKENRTLKVSCDCVSRSVKVSEHIPEVWADG